MKKILLPIFCLLLAGCSDAQWDHALNYAGMGGASEEPEEVAPKSAPSTAVSAQPAETAATADSAGTAFCRAVAMQDAGDNGFDTATQQRVFARSYAQCMMLSTR
jgi:hypothetical protein